MKKPSKFVIDVRKISNNNSKKDIWILRIPKRILDELELRGKFVTLEISDMSMIVTEVIPATEKKISENTTTQTIEKEVKSETPTKPSKEEPETPVEVLESEENTPTPKENNKKNGKMILNKEMMDKLNMS